MPTIYSLEFSTVKDIEKSTNVDGLKKFKQRIDADIQKFLEMQSAAEKRINELSK